MGQAKSKQVYAFQPLPWPEALTAFRLIDQICGIASSYATTHLDKHATVVLDKVSELQRLPHLWDAFENDFERLRGTHLVRLAAELHNALERLEGCKYDIGLMAERDLTFKSQRKAADKVLALLREVEEAHRAFHYAFELALYASMREQPAATEGEQRGGEEGTAAVPLSPPPPAQQRPESPVRMAGGGGGGGSAVRRALSPALNTSSGGGGTAVVQSVPRNVVEISVGDPPPPPAVEDSWLFDARSASSGLLLHGPSPERAAAAAAAAVRQPPDSPRPLTPASPRRPRTADASTMARSAVTAPPPPTASPTRPRSLSRGSSSRRSRYDTGPSPRSREGSTSTADQQYVVMYMPQGPDGGGPRAILVPANALQAAPNSPGPAAAVTAATTVTGGVSPFATHTRAAYSALPAAAAPPMSPMPPMQVQVQVPMSPPPPMYLTSPSSPALSPPSPQLQYQPHQPYQPYQPLPQTYTYHLPVKPMAPPPAMAPPQPPPSPPLVPYRSPAGGYGLPYRGPAASRLAPSFSGGSLGSTYGTSPYSAAAAAAAPSPYRYFSPPGGGGAPPSLHHAASPSSRQYGLSPLPSYDAYGNAALQKSRSSSMRSPALSMTASGTPDLNAFFDRPALSGGGNSGGWLSPLAAATAAAAPPPPAATGVIPGAAPGSFMTLQPQSCPAQRDAARGLSSGRVRFVDGRRGYGDGDEDVANIGDGSGDEFARGSGATNGSHHTYSYGLERSNGRAVQSYLTQYHGSDSLEEAYDLPDADEMYGGGRQGRRLSDGGGVGGGAGAGPPHRRTASYTAATAAARPASSQPPLLATLSRDADLDGASLTAAVASGGARRSPRRSGSGRTLYDLSYERLAALAGLDPELLGGGAAAGLAVAAAAAPPRKAAPGHAAAHPSAHRPAALPGESSLRRAERLSEAVEGGDWAAAVELAGLVRRGWWGDSRDGAVARGLLLQAALRGGSADAHAALGHMAERGEGLPGGTPDLAAAARHYGAAAAGGHRDATTALAYLLEHGLGVEQDQPRAAQLYAAAAQRNCPTAANNLAKMILDGRGAVAAAAAAAAAGGGDATNHATPPAALAKALFKRAAKSGSASAWYNLGVCHLQQVKQPGGAAAAAGGGAGPGGPLAVAVRDEVEVEALRCFGEAAKRGHARAALRAGYLHLARSGAAAAVEAFASAALNAGAAARAPPAPAAGSAGDEPPPLPPSAAAASGGAAAIEAEALWCLAQLAERQAAVLEVRTSSAAAAAEPTAAGSVSGRQARSGDAGGGGGGSMRRQFIDASDGDVDGDGGGSRAAADDSEERGSGRSDGDGDGVTGASGGARSGADDDVSSTLTGGTENRAVGQLLAALAGSATANGPDGAAAAAAAAAAAGSGAGADDPAAAAAVRFANELCRLDFSCCHRPAGQLPITAAAPAAAAAAAEPIRGLRRLRRQAREVLSDAAAAGGGGSAAAAATPGSLSEASSVDGGEAAGGGGGGAMAAALARLDLELQQPSERARSARRAAAELMTAAAALGHAAAQHWLAGWRWSLGQSAAAVALWEAAGRRGHGPSLMVLGQMAEAGQLPAAEDGGSEGGSGGADLAAAARYYLRAQEAATPGAVEAMRRVQKLLQRHVTLQGKLEAVAAGGGGGGLGRRP